jgi:pilus assembly protein CpaF
MLGRLETMALSGTDLPPGVVRSQIAEGIDLMVHLARTRDGHRRVVEISEMLPLEGERIPLNRLFTYKPGRGLEPTGSRMSDFGKISLRGGEEGLERLQKLQDQKC